MTNTTPIILIDGSSYLYRAFFACPPLTNAKGEPTGAIFGVINMIKSLLNQYKPTHIAVIFDAKGNSFRNDIYPEYKANRESMPDDLRLQVDPIHTIIKSMGIPLLCIEGVEADDVIGTLAKQLERKDMSVLISTGDKDMAQLVSDKITLINTMNNSILTPETVVEKFGIPPELVIDYLALMGDKSDNIPGVPGVGEKTAIAILDNLPGIEAIYNNIDAIANLPIRGAKSLKDKLLNNKDLAMISYKLATIKTDVELDFSIKNLELKNPNNNQLIELFNYYNFSRWVRDINTENFLKTNLAPEIIPSANIVSTKSIHEIKSVEGKIPLAVTKFITIENGYETILTEEIFNIWLDKLSKSELFAFDVETTSLDCLNAKLVGISFSIESGYAAYLPLSHNYLNVPKQLDLEFVLNQLKPILENNNIKKIGQNIKYDCSIMAKYGIEIAGIEYDTMLEAYILDSNGRHDIDTLADRYLNHKTISYKELTEDDKTITVDKLEIEKVSKYAAEDADVTLQLHYCLWNKLQQDKKLTEIFSNIEMPLVSILSKMERYGVLIDRELLIKFSEELAKQLKQIEKKAYILVGEVFNLASPLQLRKILYEKQNLPILKKTPKGEPSTSEDVLSELAHEYELPRLILNYRGLAKLKNTYTDKLPFMVNEKDHRIHTNYNQTGTVTGRLSSNEPNLQNIPVRNEEGRRIRQAFIAPKGYKIVSIDYSQIELRIMAHLSEDEGLLSAFKQNKDIHKVTAAEIMGIEEDLVTAEQRRNAKAVNFGLIYGMSAFGLAKQINVARKDAQLYMDRYFERYPGIQSYMDITRERAKQLGYVETTAGRRLYLPKINSRNAIERKATERAAINAPMQGTAADIIKTAMIEVDRWISKQNPNDIKMIMQVHDELIFEIKTEHVELLASQIKMIMESCFKLSVPLKVDIGIGNNWDEAH